MRRVVGEHERLRALVDGVDPAAEVAAIGSSMLERQSMAELTAAGKTKTLSYQVF